MNVTPLKALLFSITTSLGFTACSSAPIQTTTAVQVLEQVQNIEATPSTENNMAKLIQQPKNCFIEFTGNFEGGQAVEHWIFNRQGLISASTNTTQYSNNVTSPTQTAAIFNIQDPAIQANFKKLQSNFSADNLAKCH
ncbi:hypothetical protein F2A31_01675 [Acinetobacter suaedae]|uniref:Uncharacterized protein n=1 Tax=Acinetobacter suaedae TaxID=2609668 RepID=A0A5P1UNK3_9GAMM|nr:hypothetical protein [Acinetobacter sp. C16S1]QER38481.1 hypothetical protein F2A31_01675 [Acinetobacter sp. C16S1]